MLDIPTQIAHTVATMNQLLRESFIKYGSINVITGLTHHTYEALFYVVSRCDQVYNVTTCPIEHLDVQAFLLPVSQRFNQACFNGRRLIAFNVATLRDVERVTDFQFFPNLDSDDKKQLLGRTTVDSKLVVDPIISTSKMGKMQ